jgi:hypothetical protein
MENKLEQKLQTINDIVEVLNKEAKWGKFEFNFKQQTVSPPYIQAIKGITKEDYIACTAIFQYIDKREDDKCNIIMSEQIYRKRIINDMTLGFIEEFLYLLIKNILYIRTYINLKNSVVYINFPDLLKDGFIKRNLEVSE